MSKKWKKSFSLARLTHTFASVAHWKLGVLIILTVKSLSDTMKIPLRLQSIAPCAIPVLFFLCIHQGAWVYKNYSKIAVESESVESNGHAIRHDEKPFTLFDRAIVPQQQPTALKKTLHAEIEGIVLSDESWLSFAVIKTAAGQLSYREGESIAGVSDAYVSEINKNNVVVNYEGALQTLTLKTPDYFNSDTDKTPISEPTKDAGADNLYLDDYLILKPLFTKGSLEGYHINPRNVSAFYGQSGLKQGDVVVKVDSIDLTNEKQAKSIIANWSTMKEADIVVRRNAHFINIRVNVLTK